MTLTCRMSELDQCHSIRKRPLIFPQHVANSEPVKRKSKPKGNSTSIRLQQSVLARHPQAAAECPYQSSQLWCALSNLGSLPRLSSAWDSALRLSVWGWIWLLSLQKAVRGHHPLKLEWRSQHLMQQRQESTEYWTSQNLLILFHHQYPYRLIVARNSEM